MPLFKATIPFIDSDLKTVTRTYYNDVLDTAASIVWVQDVIDELATVTDSYIDFPNIEICELVPVLLGTFTAPADNGTYPPTNADNEVQGKFIGDLQDGRTITYTIPGFKKDTYCVTGGAIDLSNLDIVQVVNNFVAMEDRVGVAVTAIRKGYEFFRNFRR